MTENQGLSDAIAAVLAVAGALPARDVARRVRARDADVRRVLRDDDAFETAPPPPGESRRATYWVAV